MPDRHDLRVAIVHDHLAQTGGAERVVAAMHEIWPDAPIYTAVYDAAATHPVFREADIRTSFLQRWARNTRVFRLAMPLYPFAFEQFDLRGYDVVLSTSAGFAHGVVTQPETCHVSYCHTPARFAWRYHDFVSQGGRPARSRLLPGLMHYLRLWDQAAAQRVDHFVANSNNVARRIRKFYRRPSDVLHPPVETHRFAVAPSPRGDYFLVVSRFVGYKRIDLAVEACSRLGLPLKIVGAGPDEARLRALAGPTVEFLGRLPDAEVTDLYAHCRAFLFPGEEDFGIAPLEAMASGRPVIAYGAGGALETVVPGTTGLYFPDPTPESLIDALNRFDPVVFDPHAIAAHAGQFDVRVFQSRLRRLVEDCHARHNSDPSDPVDTPSPWTGGRAVETLGRKTNGRRSHHEISK